MGLLIPGSWVRAPHWAQLLLSLWRNRLARSAVNRKVGGSSPPRDEKFLSIYIIMYFLTRWPLASVSHIKEGPYLYFSNTVSSFCNSCRLDSFSPVIHTPAAIMSVRTLSFPLRSMSIKVRTEPTYRHFNPENLFHLCDYLTLSCIAAWIEESCTFCLCSYFLNLFGQR